MLLPFIRSPTLQDKRLDEPAAVAHSRAVVQRIVGLRGDVPVYVNLGTGEAGRTFAQTTLDTLAELVGDGRFTLVNRDDIEALAL